LVLMDIQITGELSGLDVVKRLRADGVTTPIIAVTAYAMVGDKERCIEAGCTDYLPKPLPIPQLVQLFEQYSENRFSTGELERLGTSKQDIAPKAVVSVELSVVPNHDEKVIEKPSEPIVTEKIPEPIVVVTEDKTPIDAGDVVQPKERE
jgi:response regulator of citrate/malate metabolism